MRKEIRLVQITATADELFGLTEDGKVFRYVKASDKRYAFWTALTTYGVDNTK